MLYFSPFLYLYGAVIKRAYRKIARAAESGRGVDSGRTSGVWIAGLMGLWW